MIGDSAIKTTKRGGPALDKALKGSMPKDAYAMWNKLQKSIIAPSNGTEYTNCSDVESVWLYVLWGFKVSRDFQLYDKCLGISHESPWPTHWWPTGVG